MNKIRERRGKTNWVQELERKKVKRIGPKYYENRVQKSVSLIVSSAQLDRVNAVDMWSEIGNVVYGDAALYRDVALHGNHRNIKCTFYFLHT